MEEENGQNNEIKDNFDSVLGTENNHNEPVVGQQDEQLGADKGQDTTKQGHLEDVKGLKPKKDRLKNIVIVILVLAVIIMAWLLQSNMENQKVNQSNDLKSKDRVTVSDQKEQGTVRIVEGDNSKLGISNTTLLRNNEVGVTAYFGNTAKNPNMTDCSMVFPLNRIIEKKYDSETVNAIKGLLQPLTAGESAQGFVSSLPSGTTLKYIRINDGVAEINFNDALNKVGGSCAVTAIRAQIEKTLLQFPQIKSVRICVDNNCAQDMILQP